MARLEATMGAGLYYQRKESVLRDIGRITNKQVLDEDDVALAAKLLLEARALHCGYDAIVRPESSEYIPHGCRTNSFSGRCCSAQ